MRQHIIVLYNNQLKLVKWKEQIGLIINHHTMFKEMIHNQNIKLFLENLGPNLIKFKIDIIKEKLCFKMN